MILRFLSCALVIGFALSAEAQPADKLAKQRQKVLPPLARQKAKAPAQILTALVDRLMKMTPEERDRALANLPPDRRQAIEQRLARLDQLPPEQKMELDRRFHEFQRLPPARRQALRDEMQTLRSMRPVERRARVTSPEFREMYSPEEIQLMREVWNLPPE